MADRTHSRNACALRASRRALVATTRTLSVTICCVARWKRRSTFTVSAMESGVRNPDPNTPSPRRVTSRSSCRAWRRPACRRAILSRTEFEPMSTAANVGMGRPTVYMYAVRSSPQFGEAVREEGFAAEKLRGRFGSGHRRQTVRPRFARPLHRRGNSIHCALFCRRVDHG